jgi:hypothetical protein
MKLLTMLCSPASCHFLHLRSKYSPQRPVLMWETKFHTHTKGMCLVVFLHFMERTVGRLLYVRLSVVIWRYSAVWKMGPAFQIVGKFSFWFERIHLKWQSSKFGNNSDKWKLRS